MKFLPHFPKISFAVIIICFLLPFMTVKCGSYEIAKMNGIDLAIGTQIEAESDEEPFVVDPNIFIISAMALALAGLIVAFLKFKSSKIVSLVISVLGLAALIYFYFDIRKNIPADGSMIIIITMGFGYYITTIGFLLNSLFFGFQLSQKREVFEAEIKKIEPE
ncbi:MAG: hypothetical protein A2W93_12600 [Bacteroidetes bacterium GWF2_43_63]|nr:MAG: hypothetical protein A2W94_14720 [Bacteroidetes bacterium GWE2_42_42]OFY54201.1 MAG: hypothetical protein A2W93_12600 [Bacteroidetes bacterium GWF2_43_63]HBG69634.1 hypothetical protein [Bacteroidales bacterium]HCB61474.1 hypothetical protein [Bacteroidales bacterium]HCY22476.1 hypothetical protein [Bacteroidales bacterium]